MNTSAAATTAAGPPADKVAHFDTTPVRIIGCMELRAGLWAGILFVVAGLVWFVPCCPPNPDPGR